MEVIWKTVTVILNCRLRMAITFHDVIHGFHSGRGEVIASLKTNMPQQLADMREEVLYNILLDLHKAYYALDRDIYLGILAAYKMGSRAIRLLWWSWDRLTMVTQAGGYLGTPFKGF